MKLRGIEFGTVQNASGARGFFGETNNFNWHKNGTAHWTGASFVTKTATASYHPGNLAVADDKMTPLKEYPDCIVVNKKAGAVLNAVGLTNPGLAPLLATGTWQSFPEPFTISIMAVAETRSERLHETEKMVEMLGKRKSEFAAPFAVQLNFSCPNTDLDLKELQDEVLESLAVATRLKVPLIPKINTLVPVERVLAIGDSADCDALYVSNTIPWGEVAESIDWKKLFGELSPLQQYGGGGLSGRPLFPILLNYVRALKKAGLSKPLIAGGGISSSKDAQRILEAGAAAVSIGSLSMYDPEKVKEIIEVIN